MDRQRIFQMQWAKELSEDSSIPRFLRNEARHAVRTLRGQISTKKSPVEIFHNNHPDDLLLAALQEKQKQYEWLRLSEASRWASEEALRHYGIFFTHPDGGREKAARFFTEREHAKAKELKLTDLAHIIALRQQPGSECSSEEADIRFYSLASTAWQAFNDAIEALPPDENEIAAINTYSDLVESYKNVLEETMTLFDLADIRIATDIRPPVINGWKDDHLYNISGNNENSTLILKVETLFRCRRCNVSELMKAEQHYNALENFQAQIYRLLTIAERKTLKARFAHVCS